VLIFAEITDNEQYINERHHLSKAIIFDYCTIGPNLKKCDMGCKLVLFTNRKLHKGFRLVPTSMTLNGVTISDAH